MHNDQIEKSLYAPGYYREFKCIAAECRHSCCVGWEIGIDEETYAKYQRMGEIMETVRVDEDGPCFALREDGRCPHWNEAGLCDIILSHGEGFLSEICRNHPRFYNRINRGRIEVGLGMVCEEACRLILNHEEPFLLLKTAAVEDGRWDDEWEAGDFDPLPPRDRLAAAIGAGGSFDGTIAALKAEYALPDPYTPDEWLGRFLSLEILEADWARDLQAMRGRFLQKTAHSAGAYDKFYARLLTYFVYRHVSTAERADDFRARLAFCILSVGVIRSLFEGNAEGVLGADLKKAPDMLVDWARRYSAEIEYSEDNTDELIFAFASRINR